MKRFVSILAIAAVVCAILMLNLLTFKVGIGTAHACGSYAVKGSTTVLEEGNPSVTISFSLWYNSCTGNNWTSANITSGTISGLIVEVCRVAVPGGLGGQCADNYTCPLTGVCNSPNVYSPNNPAYAKIYAGAAIVTGSSF